MASSMTTIVSTSPSPQLSSAKGTIRILSRALLYSAQFLLSSAQHPAHEGNAQQPLFQPQQGHYQSTPSLTLNVPPQCPPSTPLSCQNTSLVTDSCCFNTPGGQLLLTQFWDAHPATGPNDSWTLHGLWPDRCDGTYESYCDHSRRYEGIGETIKERDHDLWELMGTYWKDWKGDDEKLWGHEWKKHGTCVSTLRPECYEGYQERGEVLDYFARAMGLFRGLDTFRMLEEAGIKPDHHHRYTSSQIQDALSKTTGHRVTLECKHGQLKEVWYHFHVRGSLQSGEFVPADPDGPKSTCPRRGIKYLPKD